MTFMGLCQGRRARHKHHRGRQHLVALWLAFAGVVPLLAQTPDFSGIWKLDREASQITTAAVLAGLGGDGTPATLHVTHAANGTVVVSSQVNESQARAYRPGRESMVPVEQGSNLTVTSRWEGGMLVVEGSRKAAGAGSGVSGVKRSLRLSADSQTLTFEVTTKALSGERTSRLLYKKARVAGPCQDWPTPCE